ncbi:MAG: triose-phosphate isomerase [Bacteroidales bacterium]|nr:triose-phosphate isomerase [Bacteroidales bacterium]MDD2424728.1 triose-phosphate isomerase [Bacteroidales bacterium]MDD3989295.1 triose-phosphate isomerase [Bacteroidales bacterium]
MRRKIVAGNWKMNTTVAEGETLVKELLELVEESDTAAEVIVCPPFTHLDTIGRMVRANYDGKQYIQLGAQNCAGQPSGAFTGEVSALMLKSLSCKYVIIGHSERREYFGETGSSLFQKLILVIQNGMTPIFCVGEKLKDREEKREYEIVGDQIKEVLYQLKGADMEKVIIAYEPVWAIGTGRTATSEQAEEMHAFIRKIVSDKFGKLSQQIPILYGGSCKPSNAAELFSKSNVDGGLIGGASLSSEDFFRIIKSF